MASKTTKLTITISTELYNRLLKYRSLINVSKVCQNGILRTIDEIDSIMEKEEVREAINLIKKLNKDEKEILGKTLKNI